MVSAAIYKWAHGCRHVHNDKNIYKFQKQNYCIVTIILSHIFVYISSYIWLGVWPKFFIWFLGVLFVCLFFFYCTGFICVALADLELTDIFLPLPHSMFCFKIFITPSPTPPHPHPCLSQKAAVIPGWVQCRWWLLWLVSMSTCHKLKSST